MNTIYKATNLLNGKPYIGFDSAWPKRQKEHLRLAFNSNSSSHSTVFHRAIRKYGPSAFVWEILYASEDTHHTLNVMESRLIQENRSHYIYGHGYNMTLGGEGSLGAVESPTHRKRIGIGFKRSWMTLPQDKRDFHRKCSSETAKTTWRAMTSEERARKKLSVSRTAKIIHPDGTEEVVTTVRDFCSQHGLRECNMYAVLRGERRHCGGFRGTYVD